MRIAAVLLGVAIPDRPMAWCAGLAVVDGALLAFYDLKINMNFCEPIRLVGLHGAGCDRFCCNMLYYIDYMKFRRIMASAAVARFSLRPEAVALAELDYI